MSTQGRWLLRIGVLTDLVARSPTKLGRTALMKLTYLLQTVKEVPLGYNFRLYTYGPFDADVLNDISQAENLQAVVSTMIPFSGVGGYGYEFAPGPTADRVGALVAERINPFQDKMDWVIQKFGGFIAADLELLTTIVYADRDASERGNRISIEDLSWQVRGIKPRFSEEFVRQQVASLADEGLLISTQKDVRPTHCP
jgi:uncharacterized protein